MRNILLAAMALPLIIGCQSKDREETLNTDYSQLKLATAKQSPLVQSNDSSRFTELVKNGMRLQLNNSHLVQTLTSAEVASSQYSNNNLHEAGVDEIDRVQYDGQHLFVAGLPFHGPDPDTGKTIRILETAPAQANAREIGALKLSSSTSQLSGMYVLKNANQQTEKVVAIAGTLVYAPFHILPFSGGIWHNGSTDVEIFDVADINAPNSEWNITIEGAMLESRRIGDTLYLVTHSMPVIDGLISFATTEEQKIANERLIRDAHIADLLPHYQIKGGPKQPLVSADDCFVPRDLETNEGFANIVTISVIDLRNQRIAETLCLNAPISGLYASQHHLYLGGTDYADGQNTVLHKFRMSANQIDYAATGVLPGTMGWTDPGYRMSEHEGNLRIVTSKFGENNTRVHTLYVLKQEPGSNNLSVLSTLPNSEHPEPIGKPGEDIFAVRFFSERAYLVSFEQIDPLYVIDLSDPANPLIAGELEIPGVSTYLHPVNDDYLLSIGWQREDNGASTRVKVELFDIAHIANPASIASVLLGEHHSYSDAQYDHRGINLMQVGSDTLRFTIPAVIMDRPSPNSSGFIYSQSSLHLFEIVGIDQAGANLLTRGEMVVDQPTTDRHWPLAGYLDRSRMHNDTVYYVYGNDVWSAYWQAPEAVSGPF